jgi:hypothetical protein
MGNNLSFNHLTGALEQLEIGGDVLRPEEEPLLEDLPHLEVGFVIHDEAEATARLKQQML